MRGGGVGEALIEAVYSSADQQGCTKTYWWVAVRCSVVRASGTLSSGALTSLLRMCPTCRFALSVYLNALAAHVGAARAERGEPQHDVFWVPVCLFRCPLSVNCVLCAGRRMK